MTISANLGYPRIGAHRELKFALEKFWKDPTQRDNLQSVAASLRAQHWTLQKEAGIDSIPSNDFSLYDQMLDTSIMLGAVPSRFSHLVGADPLELYFAMARGTNDAQAMEMTKWFDTNYHFIVPEIAADQAFALNSSKIIAEVEEAKALGIATRPVIIGPVTYLSLAKGRNGAEPLDLLDQVLPIYAELLSSLKKLGVDWVQIDEPVLVLDLNAQQKAALIKSYEQLAPSAPKIMLTTYFGAIADKLNIAADLPVAGLHVDLCRAPEQLQSVLEKVANGEKVLSLGVIDGRNIWRADLEKILKNLANATKSLSSDRLQIAPSCSLLHSPFDLDLETRLDDELKTWLAFAKQKLDEVKILCRAAKNGAEDVSAQLAVSTAAQQSRANSPRTHTPKVRETVAAVSAQMLDRKSEFANRRLAQSQKYNLPSYPTTTIGSFPQTKEVRQARAAFKRKELDANAYEDFLKQTTTDCVQKQENLGLDVLVHGEFERNDMVEYFGEQLDGFTFTKGGWVQSYGSRCVKPPVIFGDVSRPQPMTVKWSSFAQSLTEKPMKGMLTGPVTILQWSFVRDDQPRSETCKQIALAIRDEVCDLEKANIGIIQIDEPALREGLPLREADWQAYLTWAVDCFRLSAAGVTDETQIHTHMCYAEFNDIMPAIAAMDADVISIETSRSQMELLSAFGEFDYPNEIGPGVWDIHAPRVPSSEEMDNLMHKAAEVIPADRLWVNPDCGLKTRGWPEVEAALQNLVSVAKALRAKQTT